MITRTYLSVMLVLMAGVGFAQVPDTISNIYSVIDAVFSEGSKSRLLEMPLKFSRLNEDILQKLVKLGKISSDEKDFILRQIEQPIVKKWDRSRLQNVKTVKFSKSGRYETGSYGVAVPLFSRNKMLAIVYIRHLARDIHTTIVVYEFVDGKWKYTTSLMSEIS
jgi:hypothetical protein